MEMTAAVENGGLDELDALIPKWLEAEYIDRHDPGRHASVYSDVHASHVAECQRKEYWTYEKGKDPEASPYFPLGNDIEDRYGDALREEFGGKRVRQDVGCTIFIPKLNEDGFFRLVGESDYVIFNEPAAGRGHVVYDIDSGERFARGAYNEETEGYPTRSDALSWDAYDGCIERVVETKTTKKIEWLDKYERRGFRPKHRYQLGTYQKAFDAPGELTYITRNELDERRYFVPQEANVWLEILRRTYAHYNNRGEDVIPETDPVHDADTCEMFCPYVDECKKVGGSMWGVDDPDD